MVAPTRPVHVPDLHAVLGKQHGHVATEIHIFRGRLVRAVLVSPLVVKVRRGQLHHLAVDLEAGEHPHVNRHEAGRLQRAGLNVGERRRFLTGVQFRLDRKAVLLRAPRSHDGQMRRAARAVGRGNNRRRFVPAAHDKVEGVRQERVRLVDVEGHVGVDHHQNVDAGVDGRLDRPVAVHGNRCVVQFPQLERAVDARLIRRPQAGRRDPIRVFHPFRSAKRKAGQHDIPLLNQAVLPMTSLRAPMRASPNPYISAR